MPAHEFGAAVDSSDRPLFIYPYPLSAEDRARLVAAKQRMGVNYKVVPQAAVPGCDGRVLALRESPPFVCDYALVRDPAAAESVFQALRVAIEPTITDYRMKTKLDVLRSILGEGVVEVTKKQLTYENISTVMDLTDMKVDRHENRRY